MDSNQNAEDAPKQLEIQRGWSLKVHHLQILINDSLKKLAKKTIEQEGEDEE